MSNTKGRLFRVGNVLGRSSHYSANRRSFGIPSAPSISIISRRPESRPCWS